MTTPRPLLVSAAASLLALAGVALSAARAAAEPPAAAPVAASGDTLTVPGGLAYSYPDRDALDISDEGGVKGWADTRVSLVWYGYVASPGELRPAVALQLLAGEKVTLKLTMTPGGVNDVRPKEARTVTAAVTGAGPDTVAAFPAVAIEKPGYVRLTLAGISRSGRTFGDIRELRLGGSAAQGARFGDTPHMDRGAASVHLTYSIPAELGPVTAFYNEVTARRDPITTYYCAIGWGRGYFGYQVNSPTERRVIFSVWDAGNEPKDPTKVAAEDRVQLLAKGKNVDAGRFGNEGTGGHSHLVYPWKTGKTYRFLVTAQPDGPAHAIYAGYFFFPETKSWGLIAKFRAPLKPVGADGKPDPNAYLRGFYSFDEDFWGNNGDLRRDAEFGPQWVRTLDGKWHELTAARFTHTDNRPAGRKDFAAGPTAAGTPFFLATGGFIAPATPIQYGDIVHRTAVGTPPADLDALLANPPTGITAASAGQTGK